jgi:4'-phosphopantetheinyl transferase
MRELGPEDFLPAPPSVPLGDDEIHLWFFPQWNAPVDAADSLPLRTLLAGYLNREAMTVRIERSDHGKPYVAGKPALEFNLSHSAGAALVALSRNQPLGVDLEIPRRPRPVLALAQRFFAPAEAAALAALPEARRQTAFLNLWSGKEAVLKALGRGIAFGLDRIVFDLDARGEDLCLQRFDLEPAPASWRIVPLHPVACAVGALAWHGPECRLRAFNASGRRP